MVILAITIAQIAWQNEIKSQLRTTSFFPNAGRQLRSPFQFLYY